MRDGAHRCPLEAAGCFDRQTIHNQGDVRALADMLGADVRACLYLYHVADNYPNGCGTAAETPARRELARLLQVAP